MVGQHPSVESATTHLPQHRDLYIGGAWVVPNGGYGETFNPASGKSLGKVPVADSTDVAAAVEAAKAGFEVWRGMKPAERGSLMRRMAEALRQNATELALIDSLNCGSPVRNLLRDVETAARQIDFFAGLVTEAKGATIPAGADTHCYTVREPYGVCARIVAYNHPLMFAAGKLAAPIAAGNSVIIKAAEQAPLSALKMMELWQGILPAGVVNIVAGGRECGEALVAHPDIPVVTLVGSTATGKAIAAGAAAHLKASLMELGGKNALVAYPDTGIERIVAGAIKGMNFAWCGQSCGSTSRLFLHDSIHDQVLDGLIAATRAFKPGIPTDMDTTMGAVISATHHARIMDLVASATEEGGRIIIGGCRPKTPELASGHFIEPTIIADVRQDMRIAREEVFGPVLSVLRWSDEAEMLRQVNSVEYGLTASIYTNDIRTAQHAISRIRAGFMWVNNTADHMIGAPFGGQKQSGYGREESIEELLEFTQLKCVSYDLS